MNCEIKKIGGEYYAHAPDGFFFVDIRGEISEDIQLIESEKVVH